MYKVYLRKILLPQTPENIEMTINNKNGTDVQLLIAKYKMA